MANGDKVYFKQGNRSELNAKDENNQPINPKKAGQLLFATYEDSVSTPNGNVTIQQGDVYLDLSSNDNGVRVNIANDVDKARSIFSGQTKLSDGGGQWNVDLDGVPLIYDGLTILLKITTPPSTQYTTLDVNDLGPELVWYDSQNRLLDQISENAEIILTYRNSGCANYSVPAAGTNMGALPAGTSRTRGWVVVGKTEKLHTLTMGTYTYDGSQDTTIPLGTKITLKTWE